MKNSPLEMLYRMELIRAFEERVEQLFQQGKIHGTIHLCVGQEATAVGACAVLEERDIIFSTHRGHGHCIAKGTEVNQMMAELLGRVTGSCKGKGGSMHIADVKRGNLGANGIVAAGLPLATGAALTSKMKNAGFVVLCFFGDGATNEGAFHESLNLAAIWDLPVIFFCENNQYGMSARISEMTRIENIADRGAAYGIPSQTVDGNDLEKIIQATQEAVSRARSGGGPTLLEAKTYRWKGHSRADARKYRTREEEADWKGNHDPIALLAAKLLKEGVLTKSAYENIGARVREEVASAVQFAENSALPAHEALEEDIFCLVVNH